MKNFALKQIESEDLGYFILGLENSFKIKFEESEFAKISTFGELCDLVVNKIQLEHVDDCSSQQAFYKLREAISSALQIEGKTISPNLALVELFPRPTRQKSIKQIEAHLGFQLRILLPPRWVTITLVLILIASIIGFYFNWKIALCGLLLSYLGLRIADKIGNELELQTVGQVAEKMTRENYIQSRRNPNTFNKNEIEKMVTDWFREAFL